MKSVRLPPVLFHKKLINYETLLDKVNTILYSGSKWHKVAPEGVKCFAADTNIQ